MPHMPHMNIRLRLDQGFKNTSALVLKTTGVANFDYGLPNGLVAGKGLPLTFVGWGGETGLLISSLSLHALPFRGVSSRPNLHCLTVSFLPLGYAFLVVTSFSERQTF